MSEWKIFKKTEWHQTSPCILHAPCKKKRAYTYIGISHCFYCGKDMPENVAIAWRLIHQIKNWGGEWMGSFGKSKRVIDE